MIRFPCRPSRSWLALLLAPLLLAAPLLAALGALAPGHAATPPAPAIGSTQDFGIVAVVNGTVITNADVAAREKLFALSTGMNLTPEVMARLAPQITRSLIDEKLQLQEILRRKIVVSDAEIAAAIHGIEQRNGMQPGSLAKKLAAAGVPVRTLVDQLRVQIGWIDVLRAQLGANARISPAEIAARIAQIKADAGQTEYRVGEIFIPIERPSQAASAQGFAATVIKQLRAGAPFPLVAAQFSANQTALEGGDLGWMTANRLDPAVAKLVAQMPVGAISDPVPVAGGIDIVNLLGKRTLGAASATVMSVRQVYLPFSTRLNPEHPSAQQQQQLARAQKIANSAKSCDEMEAANKAAGNVRPSNPGQLILEDVPNPILRNLLGKLPVGQSSKPLVAPDGIALLMVCSRQHETNVAPPAKAVGQQILSERIELASRQLLAALRRQARITRPGA